MTEANKLEFNSQKQRQTLNQNQAEAEQCQAQFKMGLAEPLTQTTIQGTILINKLFAMYFYSSNK